MGCMRALGIYLRKFVMDQLEKDADVAIDAKGFGKFRLTVDPDAAEDSLYPKKIVYEPTAALAKGTASSVRFALDSEPSEPPLTSAGHGILVKKIDFSRLVRLCRNQNQTTVKNNLQALSNHLASFVSGGSDSSDMLSGRTLRINLRIGTLIAR